MALSANNKATLQALCSLIQQDFTIGPYLLDSARRLLTNPADVTRVLPISPGASNASTALAALITDIGNN